MLTLRDRQTNPLFDPWEHLGAKRRNLLDRCWAGVFREQLLDHLPASKLSVHFIECFGRPSKDLRVVLGALVLQQLHDLSDAATVEAVAFNIAWHYALDIQRISDAYVCERTLRTYRRWVIDQGLDEELFTWSLLHHGPRLPGFWKAFQYGSGRSIFRHPSQVQYRVPTSLLPSSQFTGRKLVFGAGSWT